MASAQSNGSIYSKDVHSPPINDGPSSTPSSLLSDFQFQSVEIGEIAEIPDYETLNTAAVLHYCKQSILRPYLRILAILGIRTSLEDCNDISLCCLLGNFHTIQVIICMSIGYILQYLSCYRRDRGFCINRVINKFNREKEEKCHGHLFFAFFLPSILHLLAYFYIVYLFRFKKNEQLQNLMERAFLLSSHPSDRNCQRKLVRVLRIFIALGVLWIIIALFTIILKTKITSVTFQGIESGSLNIHFSLKVLLILCTFWHDMVQGMIVTSYCLQAQLLISHLYFLRVKILQHTIPGLEWMKEIEEFRKLLKYLNDDFAPAICIYTIVNTSWALSGTFWLLPFNYPKDYLSFDTYLNILNVFLWISISIAPFIQAARLTTYCSMIQNVGHEIRVRPFVYQATPGEDLDTLLLYVATLKMSAKLYRVPITGRYLCLIVTFGIIALLTYGQCHSFS